MNKPAKRRDFCAYHNGNQWALVNELAECQDDDARGRVQLIRDMFLSRVVTDDEGKPVGIAGG